MKVLRLYGVKGPVEDHTAEITPVADFEAKLVKLRPHLRRFLGIKPRKKMARIGGKMVKVADVDHIDLLSRVLAKFALGLRAEKHKVQGKTVRSYFIDTELAQHRIKLTGASVTRQSEILDALKERAVEETSLLLLREPLDVDALLEEPVPELTESTVLELFAAA